MKRSKLPNMSPKAVAWRRQMQFGPGNFLPGKFPIVANLGNSGLRFYNLGLKGKQRDMGRLIGRMEKPKYPLPVRVTFTRFSSRIADSDNIHSALKATRDGIADAYEVTDAPNGPIEWVYKQELCPRGCHGVRVEIERK